MSDIMERTLASLPRLLSSSLLGGGKGGQAAGPRQTPPPRGLQALLKAVDNARSRSEEKDIVRKELSQIKQQLEQPGATAAQWSEIFPRVVFCSVLGYDVSFSHIYAIKLAAKGKGRDKRMGYLAATFLLDQTMELAILIMGTLQQDLHSSNIFDNLMAVSAAAELVGSEIIPHMLPPVVKLLRHRQALVREKAVHCIQAYFRRAPSLMQHTLPEVKGMLGDKDPGVLSAVVTLLASTVEQNRVELVSLGLPLISILQQVRARKFPSSYDYHGIPLPWLQILLLKILAHLGSVDDQVAASLLPLLSQILTDPNSKELVSLAVVSECLETIATLAKCSGGLTAAESNAGKAEQLQTEGVVVHDSGGGALSAAGPEELGGSNGGGEGFQDSDQSRNPRQIDCRTDQSRVGKSGPGELSGLNGRRREALLTKLQPLLLEASKCVARFLSSGVPNLLYLGIRSLTQLVSVAPELASHHQGAVVQCLDDLDPVVRRQTLSLLHHMANPTNVKVVCAKMLEQVQSKGGDAGLQGDVADMVCDIAGRLAPDPLWYLNTLLPFLSLPLEPHRLSSLSNNMLTFFTKAAQDPSWPAFPEELFTAMVNAVQVSDGESSPLSQFALKVLRFVPLPVRKAVSGDKFLAGCDSLLTCEKLEVKEGVVLCVQELLLRGCLQRQDVIQWVRASLERCEHFTPRQFRQKLKELLAVASLHGELSSLSTQGSAKAMDFSLSFLDSYAADMCHKGKPFLKTQQYTPELNQPTEQEERPSSLISLTSQNSSSTPRSNDGGSLYKDTSLYESSSLGESFSLLSPTNPLQGFPAARKLWTKEGFQGDAGVQKSNFSPPVESTRADRGMGSEADGENAKPDSLDEKEELAKALFQGLSPSGPLSTPMATSSSHVPMTTEDKSLSSASSSSMPFFSSNSMTTSSQDKLVASTADLFPSASSPAATTRPDSLPAIDVSFQYMNDSAAMTDPSLFELPRCDSGGWKALHAGHTGSSHNMETSETDLQSTATQSSATVTSGHLASDLGSSSNLSISDDSLDNVKDLSCQNSPAKKPVPQTQSPGAGETRFERTVDSGFPDVQGSMYSQNLHEQMEDMDNSQTAAERDGESGGLYDGLGEDAGSESLYSGLQESAGSLYSGFEDLTLYAGEWEEEEEEKEEEEAGEERCIQADGDTDRNETQPSDVFGDPVLSTLPISPAK